MSNYCAKTAENKRGMLKVLKVLSSAMTLRAFAEEGNPTDLTPPAGAQINYEDLIKRARQEEKDKLYPQLEKLRSENATLVSSANSNLLKIGQLEEELKQLKEKSGSDEKDTTISELQAELDKVRGEFEDFKKGTVDETTLRTQIEGEYEAKYKLDKFKDSKIAEAGDLILPVFLTEVLGNTEEDVLASIEVAKKKTLDTKKSLGLVDDEGNPIVPNSTQTQNNGDNKQGLTTPPTPVPNAGGIEKFDAEYVRNLNPNSPEYREWRAKMGLK